MEAGKTLDAALDDEVATLQMIYDTPSEAQTKIMLGHNLGGHGGHSSFDTAAYQKQYKERMKPTVKAALAKGVHPGNVVCVPATMLAMWPHHNNQTMFNFAQDPIVMASFEAHTAALESTLKRGLDQGFKNEYGVVSLAVGTSAALMAYEFIFGLHADPQRHRVAGQPLPTTW